MNPNFIESGAFIVAGYSRPLLFVFLPLIACFVVTIKVDPYRLEGNGEVCIFTSEFEAAQAPDVYYSGYTVMVPGDPRYLAENDGNPYYRGEFIANNVLTLCLPALSFALLDTASIQASPLGAIQQAGLLEASNQVVGNRRCKYLHLTFPDGHILSSCVVSAEAREGSSDGEWIKLDPVQHNDIPNTPGPQYFVVYKIARMDLPRKNLVMTPPP